MGDTLGALLQEAYGQVAPDQRLDGQLLLAHVAGMERARLLAHLDEVAEAEVANHFRTLLMRYAEEVPLQYLTQVSWFMGRPFYVDERVLIPRFDTEVLFAAANDLLTTQVGTGPILDLCTGSGALAISLALAHPHRQVWGADLSPGALAVAQHNSGAYDAQVKFVQGDLLAPFAETGKQFALIVSNPPYIDTAAFRQLSRDVRHEPTLALWGGDDGLFYYRRIVAAAPDYLQPGGSLYLEIGYDQGQAVADLLQAAGFCAVEILPDWQGHDRVVLGHRPA